MLQPITPNDREQHLRAFEQTARHILPILTFSPDVIDRFLQQYAPLPGQDLYQLHLPSGHSAFLKSYRPNTLVFDYLLPSNWYARYDIVRDVVGLLQQDAVATGRLIYFEIDDNAPSHNAYFAGLLPSLGFTLQPSVDLLAPATVLDHITLPTLPAEITERPFDPHDLAALNDLWNLAFATDPTYTPDPHMFDRIPDYEDTRQSFRALYHDGRPIAAVFGFLGAGPYTSLRINRLNVEGLAVHPNYVRRGLGRYLILRCMQLLQQLYPTPAREFFIGTARTNTPALGLYRSIGFKPADLLTSAIYRVPPPSQPRHISPASPGVFANSLQTLGHSHVAYDQARRT